MKALVGIVMAVGAGAWLAWMSLRREKRRSVAQVLMDFATGAPLESVLCVGLLLLGLVTSAAAVLAP
jgi:hypothetical protein